MPDAEVPTDWVIFSVMYKAAKEEGVKYIIQGHSFRTEGTTPLTWTYMDGRYVNYIQKKFGTLKIKSFPVMTMFDYLYYTFVKRVKQIRLLYYIPYDEKAILNMLTNEVGWQDYGGKHHEFKYTGFFQSYILTRKFNIDKRKLHYSALIRSGQKSRAEALETVHKDPYTGGQETMDYCLKKLGFTPAAFEQMMNNKPKLFLDYRSYYQLIKFFEKPLRWGAKVGIIPDVIIKKFFGFLEDLLTDKMNKHCLLTNDVETTSIWFNSLRDETALKVLNEGMPLLLDTYAQYNIKSTFFFTGYIAKLHPAIVKMIIAAGHEVASHGKSHIRENGFDVMPFEKQKRHLAETKKLLEAWIPEGTTTSAVPTSTTEASPPVSVESSAEEPVPEAPPVTETTVPPEGPVTATVARSCGASGKASCTVVVRSGPSTSAESAGVGLREGETATFECTVMGDAVKSTVLGTPTSVWARDTTGNYVTMAFLDIPGGTPSPRPAPVHRAAASGARGAAASGRHPEFNTHGPVSVGPNAR